MVLVSIDVTSTDLVLIGLDSWLSLKLPDSTVLVLNDLSSTDLVLNDLSSTDLIDFNWPWLNWPIFNWHSYMNVMQFVRELDIFVKRTFLKLANLIISFLTFSILVHKFSLVCCEKLHFCWLISNFVSTTLCRPSGQNMLMSFCFICWYSNLLTEVV